MLGIDVQIRYLKIINRYRKIINLGIQRLETGIAKIINHRYRKYQYPELRLIELDRT